MTNKSRILNLLLLMIISFDGYAATAEVFKVAPGDTAGVGAGVAWPENRFISHQGVEANCITDNLTGLMWVKDLNTVPILGANVGDSTSWQNAQDSITAMNRNGGLCGYTDWRLPNINELKSLINYGVSDPAVWLNSEGFSNVAEWYYWSSTVNAPITSLSWFVNMFNGFVQFTAQNMTFHVWPVRGGDA